MYINLDDHYSVDSQNIVLMIDIQLVDSSEKMRTFIEQSELNDQLHGSAVEAKSIVITDDNVYYSPYSTISLKKRLNKFSIINKLENYSTTEWIL